MATTVASLPLSQPHEQSLSVDNNPGADARKRRREKLASQRIATATPDSAMSHSAASVVSATINTEAPTSKRRKVEASLPAVVSPTTPVKKAIDSYGKTKKPQMKYDPDVPMTKEGAAAWRREQRRKRNRESAAASRQRQRDRIVELEAEVEGWKSKFDGVMKRIRQLEEAQKQQQNCTSKNMEQEEPIVEQEELLIHSPEALVEEVFRDTIMVSPRYAPRSVSPTSPSSSADFPEHEDEVMKAVKVISTQEVGTGVGVAQNDDSQPSKMISRPAQSRIIHP
jgi:hypothetical protein